MKRVARFHKVSFERFREDWEDTFPGSGQDVQDIYDRLRLPERATSRSAGWWT